MLFVIDLDVRYHHRYQSNNITNPPHVNNNHHQNKDGQPCEGPEHLSTAPGDTWISFMGSSRKVPSSLSRSRGSAWGDG